MSSKDIKSLSAAEKNSLAYSFAALLLTDAKADISEANLKSLITASGLKEDASMTKLFAKALKGKDVSKWFSGGGGSAPAPTTTAAPAKKEAKKEEKVEEAGKKIFF